MTSFKGSQQDVKGEESEEEDVIGMFNGETQKVGGAA